MVVCKINILSNVFKEKCFCNLSKLKGQNVMVFTVDECNARLKGIRGKLKI